MKALICCAPSNFVLLSNRSRVFVTVMSSKTDVWQGTLALMVLKTLERAGSLHGYGIARQIEETSAKLLAVNYGHQTRARARRGVPGRCEFSDGVPGADRFRR